MQIKLFTIGFTKKTAEEFFSKLKEEKITRVIDIRLHNSSQLAGFAKKDDLQYFLSPFATLTTSICPYLPRHKKFWMNTKKAAAVGIVMPTGLPSF